MKAIIFNQSGEIISKLILYIVYKKVLKAIKIKERR